MTNKALDTTELLCHFRFTFRWLTFEGVYIWSILVPGYASEWQTLSGLETNSLTSLLNFIRWQVGIGELNHWQLDHNLL